MWLEDDDEAERTQEVWFLRVVPESALAAGRPPPGGPHLVLNGPAVSGLDAWTLGAAWGWSRQELAAMHAAGEHLAGVLHRPGDRWGIASAETLATVIAQTRRAEVGNATRTQILAAITCAPGLAAARGLTTLRAQVAAVLGMPIGALSRIPRSGEPVGDLPFLLDQADDVAPIEDLPPEDEDGEPAVIRVPWTRD